MPDDLDKARAALDKAIELHRTSFMTQGAADVTAELIRAVSLLLDGTEPELPEGEGQAQRR